MFRVELSCVAACKGTHGSRVVKDEAKREADDANKKDEERDDEAEGGPPAALKERYEKETRNPGKQIA